MMQNPYGVSGHLYLPPAYKLQAPKNKYNLTDEELEQMERMTPKQKKKFLKERKWNK